MNNNSTHLNIPEPMLLMRDVQKLSGRSHSSIYRDIQNGLITKPVKIGCGWRVAWPSSEIATINRARVAGRNSDEIRKIVDQLHSDRQAF